MQQKNSSKTEEKYQYYCNSLLQSGAWIAKQPVHHIEHEVEMAEMTE